MMSALREALSEAWGEALGWVLPVACVGCRAEGREVCRACLRGLEPAVTSRTLPDRLRVWSGLSYEDVARSAILALKEDGRTGLARALAPAMAAAVHAAVQADDAVVLTTVPSSRRARRRRGFDPVRLLLDRAGFSGPQLLGARGSGDAQKSLDRAGRAANRAGGLRVVRPVTGLRIVLVDDVVTTGATLVEAANALRTAGAHLVGAATVASTPRRSAEVRQVPSGRSATMS